VRDEYRTFFDEGRGGYGKLLKAELDNLAAGAEDKGEEESGGGGGREGYRGESGRRDRITAEKGGDGGEGNGDEDEGGGGDEGGEGDNDGGGVGGGGSDGGDGGGDADEEPSARVGVKRGREEAFEDEGAQKHNPRFRGEGNDSDED
jgi:hypothetical protein